MVSISTVTTWILDGVAKIEEGDTVSIVTKSGEVVKGEVYSMGNLDIEIDSEQLGTVTVDMDHIEDMTK